MIPSPSDGAEADDDEAEQDERRELGAAEAALTQRIVSLVKQLTAAIEGGNDKKGKKGKKSKGGRGGGGKQRLDHWPQWLVVARVVATLDVSAALAELQAAEEDPATPTSASQAPWATAYFLLVQRVNQSGPLHGKAHPHSDPAGPS
eukprot:SAG11_NODE_6078_length_1392_cov_1.283063_1_plen_146_part_10